MRRRRAGSDSPRRGRARHTPAGTAARRSGPIASIQTSTAADSFRSRREASSEERGPGAEAVGLASGQPKECQRVALDNAAERFAGDEREVRAVGDLVDAVERLDR